MRKQSAERAKVKIYEELESIKEVMSSEQNRRDSTLTKMQAMIE